jgi:ribosomal protein S19E (S16A)
VFGFKKIWHMHRMGNIVQQVEMEDQVGVGAFTTTG